MLHHVEAIEHDLWICSGNVINSWGDEQISHIHWNRRDGWKVIIAKCIIIFIKRFHLPVVRYLLHSIVVRGRIPGWCTCTPSCRISHLCPSPKDDPASRTASLSLWNRVYQCSGASLWTSFQTPWRTRSSSLSTEGVSISRHEIHAVKVPPHPLLEVIVYRALLPADRAGKLWSLFMNYVYLHCLLHWVNINPLCLPRSFQFK